MTESDRERRERERAEFRAVGLRSTEGEDEAIKAAFTHLSETLQAKGGEYVAIADDLVVLKDRYLRLVAQE